MIFERVMLACIKFQLTMLYLVCAKPSECGIRVLVSLFGVKRGTSAVH